jgi:uncharacterized membrane protein YphA (DoxX/SURF4 family)
MTATEKMGSKMQRAAPVVLRIGLAIVFLWFGTDQLMHTAKWVSLIPSWVTGLSHLSTTTLVHINGAFEIVFGICLLFGFFTRVVTLLLGLHMMHITLTLIMGSGITSVSIRDVGLSFAAVTLFLLGPAVQTLSIDNWLCTRYSQTEDELA